MIRGRADMTLTLSVLTPITESFPLLFGDAGTGVVTGLTSTLLTIWGALLYWTGLRLM